MSFTTMSESFGNHQYHQDPNTSSFNPDYMPNAFSIDFQNANANGNGNLDFETLLPHTAGQVSGNLSPSSRIPTDVNGQGTMYEAAKVDNANGIYSAMYQPRNYPGPNNSEFGPNFAFNAIAANQYAQANTFMASSRPAQYGPTDFESLQQKISLKKQSLDILQGVLPDPLEASQEKRYMTNTERIQVPSSDHVAEIVGKNGKAKAQGVKN